MRSCSLHLIASFRSNNRLNRCLQDPRGVDNYDEKEELVESSRRARVSMTKLDAVTSSSVKLADQLRAIRNEAQTKEREFRGRKVENEGLVTELEEVKKEIAYEKR